MSNPLIYLIQKSSTALTFPLIVGAVQARTLMQETEDSYEDGLSLVRHIEREEELDSLQQSVTIEKCRALGVPVLHLRDRIYAVNQRSVFPAVDGSARGRLCADVNVVPIRCTDLSDFYSRFYDHPDYEPHIAFGQRRLSRDRNRQSWVGHQDTEDFADAIEIIDDCTCELTPVLA